MEQMIDLLLHMPLFAGFSSGELGRLLPALAPRRHPFQKGDVLLMAGYDTDEISIVLQGEVEAAKSTRAGDEFTVTRMGPGGVFGDVLAGSHTRSPVTVRALCGGQALALSYPLLLGGGEHASLRRRLLANLVGIISDKYFSLDERIDLLLTRGLRRRVAAYLLGEARRHGSDDFTIPHTRAGLAAYLGCERSALSRELSHMAADGLLQTRRGHFRLLQPARLRALL